MKIYHADVLWDGHTWSASVVDADGAHTYSRTLRGLMHEVREAIEAAEDLDEDAAFDVALNYLNADEEIRAAVRVGEQRQELDDQRRRLLVEGLLRARTLVGRGMPVRDVASLIGVSPGRVSQMLAAPMDEPVRAEAS